MREEIMHYEAVTRYEREEELIAPFPAAKVYTHHCSCDQPQPMPATTQHHPSATTTSCHTSCHL